MGFVCIFVTETLLKMWVLGCHEQLGCLNLFGQRKGVKIFTSSRSVLGGLTVFHSSRVHGSEIRKRRFQA